MNRATCVITSSLFACLWCEVGDARAELVRRASCAEGDATREIELRSIDGVAGVCEVVERVVGESSEERTPYSAAARSEPCGARFEEAVRSLTDTGWRCSVEPGARSRPEAGPFAETWRIACMAAQNAKGIDGAATLCDCAVGLMSEAGLDERAFEALLSPDDGTGPVRSTQRSSLPDEVGMVAVDAIARCGTS